MPGPILRALSAVALVAVTSCATATRGYYHTQAESECRGRGLGPESAAFTDCVRMAEDAEYRRWSRGAPGH
jgi:hypothetical protein